MIIKCPECGREVSDKAPTCPSCGVEIAGKVTTCKYCGEVILASETVCPYCKRNLETVTTEHKIQEPPKPEPKNQEYKTQEPLKPESNGTPQRKKRRVTLIVSFILALTIFGILMYFYTQAQSAREAEDYEFAMTSADLEILQNYLLQ